MPDKGDARVTFRWKDYRQEAQPKVMRLDTSEFVRRFLLDVFPFGFQRIRHFGLLANCHREDKLAQCRRLLQAPPPALSSDERYERLTGRSLRDCPQCGKGQMQRIESFLPGAQPRGPPSSAS